MNIILPVHYNFTSSLFFYKLRVGQIIYLTSRQYKIIYADWVSQWKLLFQSYSAEWGMESHVSNHMNMMKWQAGGRISNSQAVGSQVNNSTQKLSFIYILYPWYIIYGKKGYGIYYYFVTFQVAILKFLSSCIAS